MQRLHMTLNELRVEHSYWLNTARQTSQQWHRAYCLNWAIATRRKMKTEKLRLGL